MYKSDCIFCQIAQKKSPAKIIWENRYFIAIESIHLFTPIHILLMWKEHDHTVLGQTILWDQARKIAKRLKLDSFRLVVNIGKDAYQTIEHEHIHLLGGRYLGLYVEGENYDQ